MDPLKGSRKTATTAAAGGKQTGGTYGTYININHAEIPILGRNQQHQKCTPVRYDESAALLGRHIRANSIDGSLSVSISERMTDLSMISHHSQQEGGSNGNGGLHPRTTNTNTQLDAARQLMYVSHFFNQFSEQMWQICLALFLAAYTNNTSLLLVMTYNLVTYLFVCVFGGKIGRYIDGTDRLRVARQFIGLENCAVITATFLCYLLLSRDAERMTTAAATTLMSGTTVVATTEITDSTANSEDEELLYTVKSLALLIGIHLLGAVAMILDTGFLVAVERDWIVMMSIGACNVERSIRGSPTTTTTTTGVVVLTHDDEEAVKQAWLTETNVKMRQIDLTCKMIAPALGGIFIGLFDDGTSPNHGYELRYATLLVGAINMVALVVEYICTAKIYKAIPELQSSSVSSTDPADVIDDDEEEEDGNTDTEQQHKINAEKDETSVWAQYMEDLTIYFSQTVGWAGFALALLYLNIALSFNNNLTIYLVWRRIGMATIGFWRGVSAAAGLAGTFVYQYMSGTKKMQLIDIGMISVVFEVICLSFCFAAIFVDDNFWCMVLLVGGVCFSRIGLWVFDISVTMLMQIHVPADIRGLTGGVQQSLNAFFTVIGYLVGLFFADPAAFYYLASLSFAGVVLAGLFYGIMVFSKRTTFLAPPEPSLKLNV